MFKPVHLTVQLSCTKWSTVLVSVALYCDWGFLFPKINRVLLSESVTKRKKKTSEKRERKKKMFLSLYLNPPFPKGPSCYPAAASIPQKTFLLILHLFIASEESNISDFGLSGLLPTTESFIFHLLLIAQAEKVCRKCVKLK